MKCGGGFFGGLAATPPVAGGRIIAVGGRAAIPLTAINNNKLFDFTCEGILIHAATAAAAGTLADSYYDGRMR